MMYVIILMYEFFVKSEVCYAMLFSLDSGVEVLPAETYEADAWRTVCFTGHRETSVIPYLKDPAYRGITLRTVQLMLFRYIDMAVEYGYRSFISGLAVGTDLWAAKYILNKKRADKSIRLIGVMPYLRHAERFGGNYKDILTDVEKGADLILTTNTDPTIVYGKSRTAGNSSPDLYRARNYFMVDNASAVISYFNEGSFKSGTYQTLNYAVRKGLKIRRFGLNEAYSVIEECGADIDSIRRKLVFMENVFDLPY